jgi:hypothetical protein
MQSVFRTLATGLFALVVGTSWAIAAGEGGCGASEWPLDKELAWMADAKASASGDKFARPPEGAIALKLAPQAGVTFAVAPGGKPKADAKEAFGGVITFDGVPKAGIYQVTLSSVGWIDVVQNGAAVATKGHTSMKDCAAIRKSVRFQIGSGPFVLQISSVPRETIKIAIRAAE